MMTKKVAVSVLKPPKISISDSVKTVLVVNTSYDVPTSDELKRNVYDTIQTIAYRSYINSLSARYKVKFLFLEHENISQAYAERLCNRHHADMLVNMKEISVTTQIPSFTFYTKTEEYKVRDENGYLICSNCNAHYKELKNTYWNRNGGIIGAIAYSCNIGCPVCGCTSVLTEIYNTAYTTENSWHRRYPNVNVVTSWVIYDHVKHSYSSPVDETVFKIEEHTFGEVYKLSASFNVILDRLIRPSYYLQSRKLYYPAGDPAFSSSIRYVENAEWDNAAEIWKRYLICPRPGLRKAACRNLAVYYEREGNKEESEKYRRFAKGEGISIASSGTP